MPGASSPELRLGLRGRHVNVSRLPRASSALRGTRLSPDTSVASSNFDVAYYVKIKQLAFAPGSCSVKCRFRLPTARSQCQKLTPS